MNYDFEKNMNNKLKYFKQKGFALLYGCLVTLYLFQLFSIKNSFIKNYKECGREICIQLAALTLSDCQVNCRNMYMKSGKNTVP